MPTRYKSLLRYSKKSKKVMDTGRKNYKGRPIYQGPRGGLFVRVKNRKVYRVRQ